MDLFSKPTIEKLLKEYRATPLKQLGQNFLINPEPVENLITTANLKPNDMVLEPGPGLGCLTCQLAKKAKRVVAVEKDKKMAEILKEVLKEKGIGNVQVIEGDILDNFQFSMTPACRRGRNFQSIFNFQFSKQNYKLVGNLPFSVGTAIVRRFLEADQPPEVMAVLLQKEVTERVCSQPPDMSRLSVFCQFYGQPQFIKTVPQNAFWPQPKKAAAILKITPNPAAAEKSPQFKQRFAEIVRAGFSHKRKQLCNNLQSQLNLERLTVENWLQRCRIHPTRRAETLRLKDWLCILSVDVRHLHGLLAVSPLRA